MFRKWVFDALCAVVIDNTYSNLYLKDHLKEVPKKDQALASRIFYGTLQNYSFCKSIWKQYVDKKVPRKIQILLTMSVYQLIFLSKVPAYAVVNDAVNIAKDTDKSFSGLVNAVLKKVNKDDLPWPKSQLDKVAFRYSVPSWLVSLWASHYGADAAMNMAKASTQIMPVYVRRNPLAISKEEFEKDPAVTPYKGDLYIYEGGPVFMHRFFREGKMSVQDEGSLEIALLAGPKKGDSVLDVCAAPGTKTFAMAERMDNKGSITALDLHEHRVRLIEQDAKRLHINIVDAMQKDAMDLSGLGKYDTVLCDVPCTGYGILARKPDIKLKLDSKTIDELVPVQKKLLDEGSKHVKDGGVLVYSTCTMNKKENEYQIRDFLSTHPDFRLEAEKNLMPSKGTGGFYMARLIKEKADQAMEGKA